MDVDSLNALCLLMHYYLTTPKLEARSDVLRALAVVVFDRGAMIKPNIQEQLTRALCEFCITENRQLLLHTDVVRLSLIAIGE